MGSLEKSEFPGLARLAPGLALLFADNRENLPHDLIAGLSVAAGDPTLDLSFSVTLGLLAGALQPDFLAGVILA